MARPTRRRRPPSRQSRPRRPARRPDLRPAMRRERSRSPESRRPLPLDRRRPRHRRRRCGRRTRNHARSSGSARRNAGRRLRVRRLPLPSCRPAPLPLGRPCSCGRGEPGADDDRGHGARGAKAPSGPKPASCTCADHCGARLRARDGPARSARARRRGRVDRVVAAAHRRGCCVRCPARDGLCARCPSQAARTRRYRGQPRSRRSVPAYEWRRGCDGRGRAAGDHRGGARTSTGDGRSFSARQVSSLNGRGPAVRRPSS